MERRCPYCHGTWTENVGDTLNTYRTADAPPPAEYVVSIGGVTVHECQRGKQVTPR